MMPLRSYRTFQALVLAGLGIFLFSKILDGRILFYINQRFVILVLLAALGLLILAQLVLRQRPEIAEEENEHEHAHEHPEPRSGWVLWLLALPVLMGLLIPERPLGASALQNRGVNTSAGLAMRGSLELSLALPPEQRSVLDWAQIYSSRTDVKAFEGQPVDVTGFVYHDIRLPAEQFMVSRFTIQCCVADALALGMLVEAAPGSSSAGVPLSDNTWLRVRGHLSTRVLDGKTLPVVVAQQMEPVPVPEQPYLFP